MWVFSGDLWSLRARDRLFFRDIILTLKCLAAKDPAAVRVCRWALRSEQLGKPPDKNRGNDVSANDAKQLAEYLIADDDASNRKILGCILKSLGLDADCAENGEQAVEKVRTNPECKVVFMDCHMPVLDGYDATQQIKALRSDIKIVALTGNAFQDEREKCIA